MQCGVAWFLHIGKTGGSTVEEHLRRGSALHGWMLHKLMNDSAKPLGTWHHWYPYEGWNMSRGWLRVREIVSRSKRPKVIVMQHHTSPGVGEYLLANTLHDMRQELRHKGRDFVLATALREPVARAISSIWFMKMRTNGPMDLPLYMDQLNSNYQTKYVLFSKHFAQQDGPWIWNASSDQQLLGAAAAALRRFDLVGRTEQLGAFLSRLDARLGWVDVPAQTKNRTPKKAQGCLTADELQLVRERNRVDAQLYDQFCAHDNSSKL